MPNTHRRRRRDATRQLRREGVGGVYWALAYRIHSSASQATSDPSVLPGSPPSTVGAKYDGAADLPREVRAGNYLPLPRGCSHPPPKFFRTPPTADPSNSRHYSVLIVY